MSPDSPPPIKLSLMFRLIAEDPHEDPSHLIQDRGSRNRLYGYFCHTRNLGQAEGKLSPAEYHKWVPHVNLSGQLAKVADLSAMKGYMTPADPNESNFMPRSQTPCVSGQPKMSERDLINPDGDELRMIILGTDGCKSTINKKRFNDESRTL